MCREHVPFIELGIEHTIRFNHKNLIGGQTHPSQEMTFRRSRCCCWEEVYQTVPTGRLCRNLAKVLTRSPLFGFSVGFGHIGSGHDTLNIHQTIYAFIAVRVNGKSNRRNLLNWGVLCFSHWSKSCTGINAGRRCRRGVVSKCIWCFIRSTAFLKESFEQCGEDVAAHSPVGVVPCIWIEPI